MFAGKVFIGKPGGKQLHYYRGNFAQVGGGLLGRVLVGLCLSEQGTIRLHSDTNQAGVQV